MREVTFYKYQGAGNDFLIADNLDGSIELSAEDISAMCDRRYGIGADGVMLLGKSDAAAFRMEYYNADGSGGMMCGNGGRCIAAFAVDMGLAGGSEFDFDAADGMHTAQVLSDDGRCKVIRLRMKDVSGVVLHESLSDAVVPSDGYFLDTGTRHFVRFVDDAAEYDVVGEGRVIRYAREFLPIGTNVNYASPGEGCLVVRTYEKGVEDETFACGTGIVASCIAAYVHGIPGRIAAVALPDETEGQTVCADGARVAYRVQAVRDTLSVDFIPHEDGGFSDVWLTGPAVRVAVVRPEI